MADNSRFRQRLFSTLRFAVVVNCLFVLAFFFAAYYSRSRVRSLEGAVVDLSLRNADLSQRLSLALYTLTNDYFRAAGDFVASYTSRISRASFPSALSIPGISSLGASSTNAPPLPSLKFRHYCEINDVPHVFLKRRIYRAGDLLLGHPITEISPDAVEYRGAFYPIEGD